MDLHRSAHAVKNPTHHNTTIHNGTHSINSTGTSVSVEDIGKGSLYDDSAFAIIVVGCIDLFISSFLLYVALMRKYDYRIVVFVAAVWGFVMAFLNTISFGISLALKDWLEIVLFAMFAMLELFFGYVIMSYFKFMTVVVERGLNDTSLSYFPDDPTTDFSEVQMEEAIDERPIMDDQDFEDINSSRIALT